jgi:hypothetical protein
MADLFATSGDIYSISVAGQMNAAIHHPSWYQAVRLITEEELEVAQSQRGATPARDHILGDFGPDDVVCTPVYTQFTTTTFRVVCTNENWTISAYQAEALERIREICSRVFEILPHTPVGSFSCNFFHHRPTLLSEVGDQLASFLKDLPIGVTVPAKGAAASLRYRFSSEMRLLDLTIEASVRSPSMVFVGIVATHPIKAQGFFELRPLLEKNLAEDRAEATKVLGDIVTALNSTGGNHA